MGVTPARCKRKIRADRGASLVEFALTMPLLLMLVFGIAEFGRFVAAASEIDTASLEAARYGSSAENAGPIDCDGIRAAARSQTHVVQLPDSAIEISYDRGPSTAMRATCPAGLPTAADILDRGDRLWVEVTLDFRVDIPLISGLLGTMVLSSTARQTIPGGA